jgi:integrase
VVPIDHQGVLSDLKTILKRANLRHQRFHDLRHANASLLLAEGVHPRVVMEMMGHSQVSLTMNTYSHVIPRLQDDAAAKIDAALGTN